MTVSQATGMQIRYRHPRHRDLTHIVKFSGGRSSATMALRMAEAGLLLPERGDVVLFANTSAEHPGTYTFAAECKRRLEHDYGIPCFWYEFCSVETAVSGVYRRRLTYRLVKPVPIEQDPCGYHSSGEVFEEMLSLQGMLPNPLSRSCTAKLKLYPAHLLIAEWLGDGDTTAHAGHYADHPFITTEMAYERYRRNRNASSWEDYQRRTEAVMSQPPSRPSQRWQEFTDADVRRAGAPPRQVELWGHGAAEFVTLLGLRHDEQRRINRVLSRSLYAEGASTAQCSIRTQPPGEHPYFPLDDAEIDAASVTEYWSRQDFDLGILQGQGNCTFCFMKGINTIRESASTEDTQRVNGAPSDIQWWIDIEKKYRREVPARDGSGIVSFGFFGKGTSFEHVMNGGTARSRYAGTTGTPACDCTD